MSSRSDRAGVIPARKQKQTTPKTVKIDPRDLKIAWGSDESQWKIERPNKDKEEDGYAEAIKVMWFEVKATYNEAKPGSKYKIGFNISLESCAYGWHSSPVFLMAKVGESGSYTWKRLYLKTDGFGERFDFPNNFEIDIPITTEDTTLQFGLYEIWAGRWKGGMRIYNAYVTKV